MKQTACPSFFIGKNGENEAGATTAQPVIVGEDPCVRPFSPYKKDPRRGPHVHGSYLQFKEAVLVSASQLMSVTDNAVAKSRRGKNVLSSTISGDADVGIAVPLTVMQD